MPAAPRDFPWQWHHRPMHWRRRQRPPLPRLSRLRQPLLPALQPKPRPAQHHDQCRTVGPFQGAPAGPRCWVSIPRQRSPARPWFPPSRPATLRFGQPRLPRSRNPTIPVQRGPGGQPRLRVAPPGWPDPGLAVMPATRHRAMTQKSEQRHSPKGIDPPRPPRRQMVALWSQGAFCS